MMVKCICSTSTHLLVENSLCVGSMKFGDRPRSLFCAQGRDWHWWPDLGIANQWIQCMANCHMMFCDQNWSYKQNIFRHLLDLLSQIHLEGRKLLSLRVAHIEASRCALFSMQASIGWSESECFVERSCYFQIYIYIDPCMDGHLSDTPLKFYLTQPHSPWKMILYLWYGQIAGATLALGRVYNGFNSVYRARQDDIMHTWL